MKVPILDLKPAYEELRTELDAAYHRVMESGWLLLGRELESFEAEYAASVGAKHCVGVANGLEAMQLVLMALGIGPGDEVIVPSHGYIATWLAVTHAGARPVPCESDPQTYNLDPAQISALVTPRTRAMLPIHLYGQTADMEAINAVAATAWSLRARGCGAIARRALSRPGRRRPRRRRRRELLPEQEPRCPGRRRRRHDQR
jgi:dTDP-4-amino-4,6-dideoxygalactose transaminase